MSVEDGGETKKLFTKEKSSDMCQTTQYDTGSQTGKITSTGT